MADQPDADDKAVSADVDLLESPRSIDELCDEVIRALGYKLFGEPPPRFGKYEVRGVLGDGGYGAVFRAWDPGLEREVAVKLCGCDPEMDAAIILAEARALARLSHPNIVAIFDFDADSGRLFLVMEHVDGGTLYDYAVAGQPEAWQELIEVFADVARGVAYAHDKGVIHGDIKPDNVLLHDDHRPKVADFGLARMVGKETLMPKAIGTLPYAAPELLAGQLRDELSDQWSFFVTLCHCIDGKLPIIDTDAPEIPSSNEKMLRAIEDWAGPSALHMPIPNELAEVLRVGLSFDPHERFGDMHAVAHALDGVFAGGLVAGAVLEPGVAEQVVVEPTQEESPRRRGWTIGGLTAFLLALGLGFVGEAYLLGQREASRAELAHHEPRPLDSAGRPSPDQSPPCIADGVPIEPDANVRAMCRMLRTDGYKAAVDLWKELSHSRALVARSAHDWLKLACDTTVLAQTFLHEADAADPERAIQIREAAEQLAHFAEMYLDEITNDDETAEAVSQVKVIAAGLIETSNN